MNRTWVDDWTALLELDDGRQLAVTVKTVQTFDLQHGSSCVLSLAQACDPRIVGWGKEEILAHLRAPDSKVSWHRHWDDERASADADQLLADGEAELLGGIPAEWLEGLSGKQFNETLLHFLIKKAIAKRGSISVPAYRATESEVMPDGGETIESASWPACALVLEDVRLERQLGSMVPDVICRARRAHCAEPTFDLMIEGAVTHLVDVQKAAKIRAAKVACIEIVTSHFDRVGHVPAREIEDLVCSSTVAKQWIYFPLAHEDAKRRLSAKANAIAQQLEAQQREQERQAKRLAQEQRQRQQKAEEVKRWVANSTDTDLIRAYVKIMLALWSGDTTFSIEPSASRYRSVVAAMRERQIWTKPASALESRFGSFYELVMARRGEWSEYGDKALTSLARAASPSDNSRYAIDLMAALASRRPEMTNDQQHAYDRCCASIKKEVAAENPKFLRDPQRQRLHTLLIPALAAPALACYGTEAHYAKMRNIRTEKERLAKVRSGRIKLVQAGRARQAKAVKDQAITAAIEQVSQRIAWRHFPFEPPNIVLLMARYGDKRPPDLRFTNAGAQDVLIVAERHRAEAASVFTALRAIGFTIESDVIVAEQVLVLSGLCVRTR